LTDRYGNLVDSSAASPNFVLDIHDAIVGLVKPAETSGSEVHGPDIVGDLLQTDEFTLSKLLTKTFRLLQRSVESWETCRTSKCGG
jgi:hypothetical protein